MPVTPSRSPGAAARVVAALLPIIAMVFIAFLVIGLAPATRWFTPVLAWKRSIARQGR